VPRKLFRKFLPTAHSVKEHRFLRHFGSLLHHHNLWHLNRHSVAGGVAVGLFTGLIPGPFQMLSAAICAIAFRVNLPVAIFTTLYTNPLTFVPLYVLAYKIGGLVTGGSNAGPKLTGFDWGAGGWTALLPNFMTWISSLGETLLIGLVIEGAVFAAAGYFLVLLLWRLHVVREWRRRQARRRT
jgi:uncharacterized protein (DUF2062 family)